MRPDTILQQLAAMTRFPGVPRFLWLCGVAMTLPVQGCVHDLLSVTDPDIITDEQLNANTAAGAVALHNGVILRLEQATAGRQGPDALFEFGGLLTDEWQSGDTFIQRNTLDQRIWDPQNTFHAGPFRAINRVRVQAGATIVALRQYQPSPATNIARMFAFIAYIEVLAGEHYCNGVPLSSFAGSQITFGEPLSNDSLFALATANTDSAFANIEGADSARVRWLAQVGKGRALLDRSQFAAAAAAVAGVSASPPAQSGYTRGPPLATLVDPGTDAARVNLTLRERAFWMFGTGHRLGDMRRLLRQYGRTVNSVYPNGKWFKGGNFGDAIQLPIPFDEQNNPNFVQCTNRDP